MPKKKQNEVKTTEVEPSIEQDFLVLGHLVKYNLYMLAKAIVFSSVSKSLDTDKAIEVTHRVMEELDLDSKRRAKAAESQESVQ